MPVRTQESKVWPLTQIQYWTIPTPTSIFDLWLVSTQYPFVVCRQSTLWTKQQLKEIKTRSCGSCAPSQPSVSSTFVTGPVSAHFCNVDWSLETGVKEVVFYLDTSRTRTFTDSNLAITACAAAAAAVCPGCGMQDAVQWNEDLS